MHIRVIGTGVMGRGIAQWAAVAGHTVELADARPESVDEACAFIGDMLDRLTGGRLPSTTHRVVNPAPERRGHARYSTPYFLHFRPDYLIETLPGGTPAAPITAHEFLLQRLREIKLL